MLEFAGLEGDTIPFVVEDEPDIGECVVGTVRVTSGAF